MSLENIEKDINTKEKIYKWAITIFYKEINKKILYLIAENTETGNISFVSGAQENEDNSLKETAIRENIEELKLDPNQYNLQEVGVKHEFVFWKKKKGRVGCKWEYQVFISNLTGTDFEISHTKELKSIKWLSEEDIIKTLTFSDVIEVFKKTIKAIEKIKI